MSVNSIYGFNPYMINQSTGLNDDFIANASGFNQYQQAAMQQALLQSGLQQPATDTFQKSEGSSSLDTGLKVGAATGLATAAGTYFLGDKLGVNFIKDGKFTDDILKAVETNPTELAETKALDLFNAKELEILKKAGVPEGISIESLKAYSESGIPSAFPKLNGKITQAQAKAMCEAAEKELKAIDIKALSDEAIKLAQQETLQFKSNKLSELQLCKSKLSSISDSTDLEKFFKENAKTFGIAGDEKTLETEAKKLAKKYGNRANALADYTTRVTNQETIVKSTRESLNTKALSYWDETANAFKKDAPEALKNAGKNFKLNKAGKYGAIAAGAGLVLGYLFGKS